MRLLYLIGILLASALSAHAEEAFRYRFTGGPAQVQQARKALGKWLKAEAKTEFSAKIKTLSRDRMIEQARQNDADLRDAVNSNPSGASPALAIPRPRTPADESCASLESCPRRTSAARADGVAALPDAVAELVQPWLLLQQRRGGAVFLSGGGEDPGVLALLWLDGLIAAPVEIRASPGPSGGYQLWLRSESDLDDVYAFSREAVLHPSEP